jgi:hypothetical protein
MCSSLGSFVHFVEQSEMVADVSLPTTEEPIPIEILVQISASEVSSQPQVRG